MTEKTLGQIEWEARMAHYKQSGYRPSDFTENWEDLHDDQRAAMEAGAIAVRDAALDQATKIVQLAREGELDGDFRSIKSCIQSLKRDWHDEGGLY